MAETQAKTETQQSKNRSSDVVTDLKELSRAKSTKVVNFLGKKVEIRKLTLAECMSIQSMARDTDENNPSQGFELMKTTIRLGVPAAEGFEDSDFEDFPMSDLNDLSEQVLKLAGMAPAGK